jgi:hypothetical protein
MQVGLLEIRCHRFKSRLQTEYTGAQFCFQMRLVDAGARMVIRYSGDCPGVDEAELDLGHVGRRMIVRKSMITRCRNVRDLTASITKFIRH